MTTISEAYRQQNKELHSRGNYGVCGTRWAPTVYEAIQTASPESVLDYGCGQRLLHEGVKSFGPLKCEWRNYDPCIEGLDSSPEPADMVTCTDVLEHIEPDMLDAVLDDLKRVTKRIGIFVIATGPAQKILPDGRNAHLIQAGARWWLPKLCQRFEVVQLNSFPGEFMVLVRA